LAKYADWPGEEALPVISNQRMNNALKLICKEAGFDALVNIAEKQGNGRIVEKQHPLYELIGCHTCRKSFITISMRLGMQESVIKSISGHSKNSRAFTRYYDIVDGHKQAEMSRIFGEG
jgi:integrase